MNTIRFGFRSAYRGLCAFALFLLHPVWAVAQTSTGTITGTVADAGTQQFLNQAEVQVQGTDITGFTDNEGFFRLAGVPAGPQTLLVNYLGLTPEKFSVTVVPGQTTTRTFQLKSDVYVMGKFEVASEREGQAAALNQQRNADYMKSVVASDAFGDLHDNNAAELLKSIPGIALDYSGEDAIGFTMRGQDSIYASVTTDGNPIASGANGGPSGRQVNFRNVTVDNIESVEINRAPTAAQPANSLGGSVNFVTKNAFSQRGRRVRLQAGANFNSDSTTLGRTYEEPGKLGRTVFPAFQFNYSDTFRADSNHPLGVVVMGLLGGRYLHNTQFQRTYTYVPGLATGQQVAPSAPAIANSLVLREASAGWRQRSVAVNLDYKVSERTTAFVRTSLQEGPTNAVYGQNHSITFTAANQTSGAGTALVALNGNSADTIDSRPNATPVAAGSSSGSRITKVSGQERYDSQVYQFSGGAKHRLGDLNVDYNAYFSRAFDRADTSGQPFTGGMTFTYDLINVGFLAQNVQDAAGVAVGQTSGADYRSLANYGRLTSVKGIRSSLDRRWGAKVDAKWQVPRFPVPLTLQAGLADDMQCRIMVPSGANPRKWYGAGPDGVFGNADDAPLNLGQFADMRLPSGWVHRGPTTTVDTGEWLDIAKLGAYATAHPEVVTADLVTEATGAKAKKVMTEDIPAAYVMGSFRFGRFTVLPGMRWEQTIDTGKGWGRLNTPIAASLPLAERAALTTAQYRRFVRKTTYDGFYPNCQARYSVTPNFIVRGAYTETIGRPNFGNLLPGDTVNPANGTISRNNPDLEPFQAKNYDISAEYYFGKNTGSFMASLFRKEIRNYFANTSFSLPGGANNGYDGMYEGYTVTQQSNIPGTTRSEGLEFGYQQRLRFLPGELGNLSAIASYTHVRSTPPPGVLRVTGFYPDVFFGGLTYAGHGLRVDLKYNLRKQWYTAVNNTNGELTYNPDDARWDLAVDYRFARRYEFFFNWRNFTRSSAITYVGSRLISAVEAGSLINVGVRTEF